jgi:hypothetical protein
MTDRNDTAPARLRRWLDRQREERARKTLADRITTAMQENNAQARSRESTAPTDAPRIGSAELRAVARDLVAAADALDRRDSWQAGFLTTLAADRLALAREVRR